MVSKITPEFCWSEAERLTKLAILAIDRGSRNELLQIAAHYRQLAAQLLSELANTNAIDGKDRGTR